jgi:hypothetical protein
VSPRQLSSGTLIVAVFARRRHGYGQNAQVEETAQYGECRGRTARHVQPRADVQQRCPGDYLAWPHKWLAAPCRSGSRRLLRRKPVGQVSSEIGQLGVGSRGQSLVHPQVELVLSQHARHERGFESADHLLAISVRSAQVASTI